jgi:hypothetical protein
VNMGVAAAEKKQAPAARLVDYVQIPRAAFTADVWDLPWDVLKCKAERGERGMSVLTTGATMQTDSYKRVIRYDARPASADLPVWVELADTALMRQGDAPRQAQAFLLAQSW